MDGHCCSKPAEQDNSVYSDDPQIIYTISTYASNSTNINSPTTNIKNKDKKQITLAQFIEENFKNQKEQEIIKEKIDSDKDIGIIDIINRFKYPKNTRKIWA